MIAKVEMLTNAQLEHISQIVGEAFVTNELFHNWGTEEERRNDVLKYMGIYVDYVYRAGELYANENMTGFIGLEDSYHKPVWPQIRMIFKMLVKIRLSKVKSLLAYAKQRHFEALMVCVDKNQQGKGIASELVRFAKEKADMEGIPLLFDTDMKAYAEMYQHFGCELYNSVKADNGVTRYSLCYRPNGQ